MKKFILTVFVIVLSVLAVFAQYDEGQKPTFYFYYIAHDNTTPVVELDELLRGYFQSHLSNVDDSESGEDPVIIYLSSGERPFIVKAHLPGGSRDWKEYDNVITNELFGRNSHEVNPTADIGSIIGLINDAGVFGPDGGLSDKYGEAVFQFYVTPRFWLNKQNEELIATLFYILDIEKAIEMGGKFDITVYYPPNAPLYQDNTAPFGKQNLGNINHYLTNKIFPIPKVAI